MSGTRVVGVAIAALAYVVGGKVGLSLASLNPSATAVWAPTGIAIASVLLLGRWALPGIFVAALVVNITTAGSLATSIVIAFGNALEGLVGAWLIASFCGGTSLFERVRHVVAFAAVALVSPVVSATIGVTGLAVAGYVAWSSYRDVWLTWWLGDASGALVFVPLIITWLRADAVPRVTTPLEQLLLGGMVLAGAALVFTNIQPLAAQNAPIAFLTFPLLAFAAYRYGPRGASLSIALVSMAATYGTVRGFGPFARADPNESLLFLQAFMAVAALTSLSLAAADVERRRAEAALRAREEELRRVEAQKVVEREEFLSIAAHELRTPVTALQLAVQLLLRRIHRGGTPTPEEMTRALTTASNQSTKLARLITQLLDNVRFDGAGLLIEREHVDIGALVAGIVDEVRATSGRKGIVASVPSVDAFIDPIRIEQVVRNLIDNAVKFNPSGPIEVRVDSDGGGDATIEVRDHGAGIAPERRAMLFQRYEHVRQRHEPGGLGLGLYVCRQIVERHGGTITAEFPADGGTRMRVRLPVRDGDQPSSM
ncbi:MAG TPA: MASE1 domain-containing protein [Candidatus Limnocylindrales bacterium]|nr:MASE1 domain-containing protein [Candidatus Limnocylindrales bacterium]